MAESADILKNQISGLKKQYLEIEKVNQHLNERILELYSLYQISSTLSSTLDLEEILKSIKKLFKKTFNVDHYSIMLFQEDVEELKVISYYGLSKSVLRNHFYESGTNIFSSALDRDEMIYVPDMSKNDQYEFYSNNEKTGSFLCIPLKPGKMHPLGVLNLYRNREKSFTKREIALLSKVAEHIAKVIDKTLLFKYTKELSITDELTSLYNRRYFRQRYEREVLRAKRYKRPLSLLMVDIDYFKTYNDINGHILGDKVLKKVACLLEKNLRKADIVARYGGEEFVILLPEIDKDHAYNVAEKLRRNIETTSFPEEHNQPNHRLTISIGLATLLEDSYSAKELLDFADKALYQAKRLGRNQVVGYHFSLNGENNIYPLSSVASSSAL